MDSSQSPRQIQVVHFNDRAYPKILKKIPDPPKTLYLRGELKDNEQCFAIVGTRRFSHYGREVAFGITGDLAEAGLTIVSGLAPGIDTICHQSVVEKNKRTIAVLGTGLDEESVYPQSNLELSQKIIESGGCLISDYPAGTRGTQFTFPKRNRIIAGISLGVLVVEAKEKSGALITADWARKQGRKVFAIPGPIFSSNSKGPHSLIKNGAKLVEAADDILEELNLNLGLSGKEGFPAGENQEEQLILDALKEGALYVDKIIEKTSLSAAKALSTLSILEIKSKVRNLGGNIYAISSR